VKVKQKRTAADYLKEQGYADLPDAVDPEEDEDTEVQSEREFEDDEDGTVRRPPASWIAQNLAQAYCYGNCGRKHRCTGDGCNLRDSASFAEPCPWETRSRLCVSCAYADANPARYEGPDYDEYFDG
jgi:hypothetical protein